MEKFHALSLADIEAELRANADRRRALMRMLSGRLLQSQIDATKAQRAIERAALLTDSEQAA